MLKISALLAVLGLGLMAATPAQAQLFSGSYCGSAIGGCGGVRVAPPPHYGSRHHSGHHGRRAGGAYCAPLGSSQWLRDNPRPSGPGWHAVERVPGKPCGGWHRRNYAGHGGGGYGVAAPAGSSGGGGVTSGELKCPPLGSDKFYELNPKPAGGGWEMVERVPGRECGGWHRVVAR